MNRNFIMHLQNILDSSVENDSDHMIAAYILQHISEMKNITIQDMARECYTSTSTISRFVKEIGFRSLTELKDVCTGFEYASFELVHDSLRYLNFNGNDDEKTLNNYVDMLCTSLQNFSNTIDFEAIDRLNRRIHDSKDVVVFGMHLPGSFAKYFQYMMMTIGKFIECYELEDEHLKKSEIIAENALVVIFSMEGNYLNANKQVLANLKKRKAHLVLVTQNPVNKFINLFDEVIYCGEVSFGKAGRYKLQLFTEILFNRYVQNYFQTIDEK